MINLSDTLPAPPAGRLNGLWQKDSGGNVSVNIPVFVASGASHAPGVVPDPGSTAGTTRFLCENGTFAVPAGSASGTVTSVGLTVPSWLSVSGSPVTTSGTLAVTSTSGQTANQFLATPNGSTGAVGLRAIVQADLPLPSFSTLTDGATVTWATGGAWVNNATLTMVHTTATRAISLTGLVAGATGTLIVKQDSTGGAALTFGTNSGAYTNKVIGGGAGAVTVTSTASAVDILTWVYDGTSVFWTIGKNYS